MPLNTKEDGYTDLQAYDDRMLKAWYCATIIGDTGSLDGTVSVYRTKAEAVADAKEEKESWLVNGTDLWKVVGDIRRDGQYICLSRFCEDDKWIAREEIHVYSLIRSPQDVARVLFAQYDGAFDGADGWPQEVRTEYHVIRKEHAGYTLS